MSTRPDFRGMYGGELTDELRDTVDRWRERELPDLAGCTSRLKVCPCAEYGSQSGVHERCKPAELPIHATCDTTTNPWGGLCWTWTGCDDPACDHPACGGRGSREFDAWAENAGLERNLTLHGPGRVLAWATPWVPWEDHGRHAVLLNEYRSGKYRENADPTRMLRALEKGPVIGVTFGEKYLAMELALADQGVPMEARMIAETDEWSVVYHLCRHPDEDPYDVGGCMTGELRLARALDLDAAPDGYQGALFA